MVIRAFLTLSIHLILSSNLHAGEVTLEEVLDSVSKHYPVILQTHADRAKAQADYSSSKGGFDPVLKASSYNIPLGYYRNSYVDVSVEQPTALWGTKVFSGWRIGDGRFPIYDGKMSTFSGGELRVGMEVPLLRNGSIDDRRNKILTAENGVQLTESVVALIKLETNRIATHRYWEWVGAGRKVAIAEKLLEVAQTREKAMEDRFKKGDGSQFEYRENRRMVIQRESTLLAAERSMQKGAFELSLFYRDNQGNPVVLNKEDLPRDLLEQRLESDPEENLEFHELVNNHPEVQRVGFQIYQNQLDLRLSRNATLPRVDLSISYSHDLGRVEAPETSSSYSLLPVDKYPSEFKLGVIVEFPLFLRTARGQVQSLQAVNHRLDSQAVLTRNRIETTMRDSLQAMRVARKKVDLAMEEYKIAKELEEGEKLRFQEGDSQLFIVNLREQSTGEAAVRKIDSMIEYYKAKADFLAAIANKSS